MKNIAGHFLIIVSAALSGCQAVPECTTQTASFSLPDGIPFIKGSFSWSRDNAHVDCGKTLEQLKQDEADRARLGIQLWPRDEDEE